MADTQHLLLSCSLVALPTQAFYGAELTIQQCNTLRLVVAYCQLILKTILPLALDTVLH